MAESTTLVAEYVWIDGASNLRSKIKIMNICACTTINMDIFPDWNFDGSSTGQSETRTSDLVLRPIYYTHNPLVAKELRTARTSYYMVLCDVVADGKSSNYQRLLSVFHKTLEHDAWFGIEQEYMLLNPTNGDLYDQHLINTSGLEYRPNQHYCSVGAGCAIGRRIAMEHMSACIEANLEICGINSEVSPSQWEFQIGPLNPLAVANQLWLARYILIQVAERHGVAISFHPKPFANINGSGAHTNFSTRKMREPDGLREIQAAIEKLSKRHSEHIAVYGEHNHLRLTGTNETAHIDKFSYGNCDRGSSIRIPVNVLAAKCGYMEDRRPAANCDPYLVVAAILETVLLK